MANQYTSPIKAGDVFGILTVQSIESIEGHKYAICLCECGRECRKKTRYMRSLGGESLQASCGCLQRAMARERIAEARAKRTPATMDVVKKNLRSRTPIDPTPEEITERAAEIRAEWPPERFEKHGGGCRPVEIMVCRGGGDVDQAAKIGY